jgi:hypothetical protein
MDPHSFKEDIGSIFHCDDLLARCEDGHLRKPMNYHKYTVISLLGGWKTRNVIHQNGFPRPLESRKRGVYEFILDGTLGNDTGSEIYDILFDVLWVFWPIKMFL